MFTEFGGGIKLLKYFLKETLKENLTKLKSKDDCITDKIISIAKSIQEEDNPCIENTGDAIASTNNVDSIVVNIQDFKFKKCIDKFNDIILDVTTDDFTDNMSLNEKIIKTSRRDGIILEEDFQTFMDVINIEKFDKVIDIPEYVFKLTVKLHSNKEYFNRMPLFKSISLCNAYARISSLKRKMCRTYLCGWN